MGSPPSAAPRARLLAAGVGLWLVAWVVVGIVTGLQLRRLTEVSDSLAQSGRALDAAGTALQDVGRLPLIGERPRELGDEVRATAAEIRGAGESSRETVRLVSVLLGAALVLIPTVPVVAFYLPYRSARSRDRRAVARALRSGDAERLEKVLAHRAVQHLPIDVLQTVTGDPWGELDRRSYRALANAELTRLGLAGTRRLARWSAEADQP